MKYTIYHNPRCSKSRAALTYLQEKGADIEVVLYLENLLTETELAQLLEKLDFKAADLVRKTEKSYKELAGKENYTEADWIRMMVQNPKLIERPIIVKGDKAVIGRPTEAIDSL